MSWAKQVLVDRWEGIVPVEPSMHDGWVHEIHAFFFDGDVRNAAHNTAFASIIAVTYLLLARRRINGRET